MYPVLGAGNANTIYIHPRGLLRVSKASKDPNEILKYYHEWKDRLPQYIGDFEVVEDPHFGPAILMDHIGKGLLLVEFKPKWLTQSPDAPVDARACRTCAVDCLRNKNRKWCPLKLLKRENLAQILQSMHPKHPEAVAEFLKSVDLLDRLAECQQSPSVFDSPTPAFLDAMSARDCTILIEGSLNSQHDAPKGTNWSFFGGVWVRARIVDLDPKMDSQMAKWRSIEESLRSIYRSGVDGCALNESG